VEDIQMIIPMGKFKSGAYIVKVKTPTDTAVSRIIKK